MPHDAEWNRDFLRKIKERSSRGPARTALRVRVIRPLAEIVTIEDMDELVTELFGHIVTKLPAAANDRDSLAAVATLTNVERTVYFAFRYSGDLRAQGFESFLVNHLPYGSATIAQALSEIGAQRTARLVSHAVRLFEEHPMPEGTPWGEYRQAVDPGNKRDELAYRLQALNASEELVDKLLAEYVGSHLHVIANESDA